MRFGPLLTLVTILASGCYADPTRAFLPGNHVYEDAGLVYYPDVLDAAPEPDARICSTLATTPGTVTYTSETGSPPTLTGGTIADGIYVLQSMQVWNNAGGGGVLDIHFSWKFTGAAFEASARSSGSTVDEVSSGTYTTSAATITFVTACGGGGGQWTGVPYSAGVGTVDFEPVGDPDPVIYHYALAP